MSEDDWSMSEEELRGLPVSVPLLTSARALSISKSQAYILVRAGKYPVRTFRSGSRYLVAKGDLMAFLRLE